MWPLAWKMLGNPENTLEEGEMGLARGGGDRRLAGIGRADDAHLLSHARRRIDARFVAREAVMIYILLCLLGVPLSIILILMLLGIR